MSKDNGGPAFPGLNAVFTGLDSEGQERYETEPSGGMTLRDYFAAEASDGDIGEIMSSHFDYDSDTYLITRQQARYIHADTMLAERAK